MRVSSGLFGIVMLGVSGVALADDPVRLDAAELDAVSAGAFSTAAAAFTFPTFGQGNLINAGQLSQTLTISQVAITPTSFQTNATAQAAAIGQVQAIGVGTTASGTGGGVFTTVFLF